MQIINRFTVFTKRFLNNRLYLVMLILTVLLTAVYMCLPSASRSADIRVAVYSEETRENTDAVMDKIGEKNSLYTFYASASINDMINDVKSGYAECGYFIPEDFFNNYINGNGGSVLITEYSTPETTLGAAINETLFSAIFSICADRILILAADMPEYNDELTERLYSYMNSDSIFKIKDSVTGEFSFENMVYKINLPVYEICLIFILFSGLLGLLVYEQDNERGIYICLKKREKRAVKAISVFAAMLPILLTGIISCAIIGTHTDKLLFLLVFVILSGIFDMIVSLVIRKSTVLTQALPLIILVSVIITFISTELP